MRVRIATVVTFLFFLLLAIVLIRDLKTFSFFKLVPAKDVKSIQDSPFNHAEISPTLTPASAQIEYYQVVRIADGDTIVISIGGKNETVRLLGIDTPEVVDPRRPVQCFGKEASNKAKEILLGKSVRLEQDTTQSDRDRYKRLLRYVYLSDNTHVNLVLIQQGFAHEYTYDNPYKYQKDFRQAEIEAREAKLGLWGDVCMGN